MIKIENIVTPSPEQWEAVIRGMRNPKNSWDKSDSYETCGMSCETRCAENCSVCDWRGSAYAVGENDAILMERLVSAGTDHRKFMRMIPVYMDITAPLYWWKECDTYKVGTVANSCSTMHKIHDKPFELDDFSHERMSSVGVKLLTDHVIPFLEECRKWYNTAEDAEVKREYWDDMIQALPSSYNQKRTIFTNYEVLRNMYRARKNHKLPEWREFCVQIKTLPYHEYITGCIEW
jgi:hypothetical protein